MKEMEKRDWIGFSQSKMALSLFIHYDRLLLDFSSMFSRVCITLILRIYHTSQLFMCVCNDCAACDLVAP